MGKIIAVVSGKGGTGKTTSAINLAGELVRRGKKVLIVDTDTQGNATSNLELTEVSKIECQLKVNKPEEADTAPYEINDTPSE